ncbi:MAG: 16S rRNA (cytosine(1402)-N(4))-methyltransferase RsmH [Gammaproteobacteria bacterium]|nr:16S rRNA (cytosine(1402)-N(4))-methyltransferase RsmH [Gammaproteobacteria bacterium]NIR82271.1 16S rRNA (cytosine(1402)-N(4))-methyltransferase RsmH [Gammaproteobacteria bacterium]NIR91202.1 16S rRNA (cytosine(1402)-N(4))-methyltransferase RsmH [Gammaproteobacteria bacterium]NIU03420.1 16S rRNA (cytosine(1402)-N(4))-methyltransferase RsmH [Gammaproteobacteria bacterium]NIX84695.1 16S rRNA (cytosine(1402)-N(4))-methyltransferase RsmH [Gammaproteobacteria bacterium]
MPRGSHEAVLVDEVLTALDPRPGGVYVDCTFGRGGHTRALLARIGPNGRLLAMDKDPAAVAAARALAAEDARVVPEAGSFTRLVRVAEAHGIRAAVDGILFDLGVSSPQLEDPARGFSFREEGPLDMRMDPQTGMTAAAWLRSASMEEIAHVLREYGEERYARRIARAVVAARRRHPLETTRQLADIVQAACPTRERDKHPATRTFQAVRIFINRELAELAEALEQAVEVLHPGGRLAVISFHSLEDRLVKRFIRAHARPPGMPRELPMAPPGTPRLRALGKPVRPTAAEVARNPRARSAVLRAAEKRA